MPEGCFLVRPLSLLAEGRVLGVLWAPMGRGKGRRVERARDGEMADVFSFSNKDTSLIKLGHNLITSLYLNYLLRGSVYKSSHRGVRASTYGF